MRTRLALAALFAGTLLLGASASAQALPSAWDVLVSVRKDRVGNDVVTVGARAADYPPDLLQGQLVRLGEVLARGGARGASVHRDEIRVGEGTESVLRGVCAVDGLIDAATGSLAVAPIAQAFAGAPAPYTVRRMLVSFDGVTTRPGHTLAYHTAGKASDLAFTGRRIGSSVEYDVRLLSQDPARLVVHETAAAAKPVADSKPAASRLDAATLALFALAALASGALVYCLILLVGRRPVAKS